MKSKVINKDNGSNLLIENEFGFAQQKQVNNLTIIEINHQHCTAQLSLQGGQVLAWQRQGEPAVFWLSKTAKFKANNAIRGGIPLCWPWFGGLFVNGQNLGNHGFARENVWQLSKLTFVATGVEVVLTFTGENKHSHWPYPFLLEQTLYFSRLFSQQLMITNLSSQTFTHTMALHNYFSVSSPQNITINHLLTANFDDKITQKHVSNSADKMLNFINPVDRIYHSDSKVSLHDHAWQRIITIEKENSKQWVLWNPTDKIAQTMADIHQGGAQEFICLEVANTEPQSLAPDEKFYIKQAITVKNY